MPALPVATDEREAKMKMGLFLREENSNGAFSGRKLLSYVEVDGTPQQYLTNKAWKDEAAKAVGVAPGFEVVAVSVLGQPVNECHVAVIVRAVKGDTMAQFMGKNKPAEISGRPVHPVPGGLRVRSMSAKQRAMKK
jgi:hypothetical protein